jgi:plasmid maintenance system antidote protein VapI
MSDVVPGTLVHMRIMRRFSHYMPGELIAVPFEAARDLDAKRLAQPLQLFVPTPVAASEAAEPVRQPAGIVRK